MKISSVLLLPAAILLAGCGGDKPAEKIEEQLDKAQEAIESAGESMENLRAERQELAEEIARQTSALQALVEQRLTLFDWQLEALEAQLARLPAAQETEMRGQLEALRARRGGVAAQAEAWRTAAAGERAEKREALRGALEDFQKDLEALHESLRDGGRNPAG